MRVSGVRVSADGTTDRPTDRWNDRPTDRLTDRPSTDPQTDLQAVHQLIEHGRNVDRSFADAPFARDTVFTLSTLATWKDPLRTRRSRVTLC